MGKKIYTTLLIVGLTTILTFSSCAVWNLDANIKKVELGMHKKEVISILGNTYLSLGAVATEDGSIETIRYEGANNYVLRFLDGVLFEWFQEVRDHHPSTPHNHH